MRPYRLEPLLEPSPELGYLLGAIYGDGCVYPPSVVTVQVTERSFAEEVFKAFGKIGLYPHFKVHRSRGPARAGGQNRKPQFEAAVYNRALVRWFQRLDSQLIYEKYLQHVDTKRAFLRGFYEAEGHLSWRRSNRDYPKKYPRISLTNTKEELARLALLLLTDLNYHPKIRYYEKNHAFRVYLHRKVEVFGFLDEIGPCIKGQEVAD